MKAALLVLLLAASVPSVFDGPEAPTPVRLRPTRIEFEVTPATVEVFLDGERLGWATDVGKVEVRPGRRVVRLVRGQDVTEFELEVPAGRTLSFVYDFGD